MLPGAHSARSPLLIFLLLALTALTVSPAAGADTSASPAPAAPAFKRKPAIVHTPQVETAVATDQPGYRDSVSQIAARYTQFYYTSNLKEAREEALKGLALARQAHNESDEAQFLKALGYVAWLLGDTAASINYEQQLLLYAEKNNNDDLRSIAYRVMGIVQGQTGDREKEQAFTHNALRYAERSGNNDLRIAAVNNLGTFAMRRGEYGQARTLHEEVLAYREKNGDIWDIAGTLTNLGDIAQAEKKFDSALDLHERAYALRIQAGDGRGQVRSLRQIGGILRELGRPDEALARLTDALARGEKITGHQLVGEIWKEIALTHEARGEYAKALAADRMAAAEFQQLAGDRTRDRIAELEARFELAKKQQMIDALSQEQLVQSSRLGMQEAQIARSRLQRYALGAVLLISAIALGTVIQVQRGKLDGERKARTTAEQADRLKSRLLAIASHDLRSPLGNLYILAENLREEQPPGQPTDKRLDSIALESQRLLRLVEDLLETAALEVGRLELRKEQIDLAEVTRSVIDEYQWQAATKQQKIIFPPPPDGTGHLTADGRRLQQVLTNLLGNAIKFSPPGRDITLALERTSTEVHLRIIDQGPGMSAEEQTHLFTPFARLNSQPTAGETSHGFGLSIAHEIVRLHGGAIRVESALGQGTTFIVQLPA